jgi:3-oxoacyl-[acyl-carrier protein] reductase
MNGTVAIIGAGRGIGKATALRFLKSEWRAFVTYCHNEPDYKNLYPASECQVLHLDVTDESSMENFFSVLQKSENPPEVLVYNTGITGARLCLQNTPEDLQSLLDVNIKPAVSFLRRAGEFFLPMRRGKIFFISSVTASKGGRGHVNYAISKSGLEALVRVAAIELSRSGIMVNAIAPGIIETEMSEQYLNDLKSSGRLREVMDNIAMRRAGKAEEVASLIYALSDPEINYLTGQVIHIDGGFQL